MQKGLRRALRPNPASVGQRSQVGHARHAVREPPSMRYIHRQNHLGQTIPEPTEPLGNGPRVALAIVMSINGSEDYDLVILGGGTGSTVAAWTFAGQGQRVAVVDRKYIGGSSPNIYCLMINNII